MSPVSHLRTGVIAAAILLSLAGSLPAENLITNGSFESGFAGWAVTGTNANSGFGSCDQNWTIMSGTQTPCAGQTIPGTPYGSNYGYTSFDGNGPQHFYLSQSFLNRSGVTSASLSLADAYSWLNGGVSRTFSYVFLDAMSTVIGQGTIFTMPTSTGSQAWTDKAFDATSILAAHGGETLTLQFDTFIPGNFNGPAGQGLDNVQLNVSTAPEPTSMMSLATGLVGVFGAARRKRKSLS